jgi:cephalosporin hydroxylase
MTRLTFETALDLTRSVGSNASYEDDALEMLWHAASSLPGGSAIVEIGCEYGRSTSLLVQLIKERSYQAPHIVDPFYTYKGDAAQKFIRTMIKAGYPFHLHVMTTAQAYDSLPNRIDLVHIDGDHSTEGVTVDCRLLLPRVNRGGYAVFHDYGTESLPEVKPVVDRYTKTWTKIGKKGTCFVVRKP